MKKRKILIICNSDENARNLCLKWHSLLKDEIKTARCLLTERRVETPYVVIDFKDVSVSPDSYEIIVKSGERDVYVLKLAIGKRK